MGEGKQKCAAKVYSGGSFRGHPCVATAKYEHNGTWYCKTHHPPTVNAKRQARNAAWDAAWAAKVAEQAEKDAARKELERRAGLYDEMLAALRRAALALAFAAESLPAMRDDYEAVSAAIARATGVPHGS
jgi:hypothetical protein